MITDEQRETLKADADPACKHCHGAGTFVYGDTGLGIGVGGQTITEGPCRCTETWKEMRRSWQTPL